MPENFDSYYTVEVFTDKEVFEVVATCEWAEEAFSKFVELLIENPARQVRMYSPKGVWTDAIEPRLPMQVILG